MKSAGRGYPHTLMRLARAPAPRAATTTPTVEQLGIAPELSALAILESALQATTAALLAAQPELLLPDDEDPSSLQARVAEEIIEQSRLLRGTINRYRLALIFEPGPDGPLPF
jgi:hypothetical protein